MSSRKVRELLILNAIIVTINIALFSNALLGLSLVDGTAFSISVAWTVVLVSAVAFFKGNSQILNEPDKHSYLRSIHTLDHCITAFQVAFHNGGVFRENIQKNIEQIMSFRRKEGTIKSILLNKFSPEEMSFQKFIGVLREVENVIYVNMRSILNKISAFDIHEYETIQRRKAQGIEQKIPQEKMDIFNEYIDFVNNATQANEYILLKLDKMLLEMSRYNSLEDGDVQKLPAMVEMDELIKNAGLYK